MQVYDLILRSRTPCIKTPERCVSFSLFESEITKCEQISMISHILNTNIKEVDKPGESMEYTVLVTQP